VQHHVYGKRASNEGLYGAHGHLHEACVMLVWIPSMMLVWIPSMLVWIGLTDFPECVRRSTPSHSPTLASWNCRLIPTYMTIADQTWSTEFL
jgi:hypothetical protein